MDNLSSETERQDLARDGISSTGKRNLTLIDMPPEILSRICEFLLPDRFLDRARKLEHQFETVEGEFGWSESLPRCYYSLRKPFRDSDLDLDYDPSYDRVPDLDHRLRHSDENSTRWVKYVRSKYIQRSCMVNDMANFARTCKWVSNAARDIVRTHHFLLTIAHEEVAFEGVRCSEPYSLWTSVFISRRYITVNDDEDEERIIFEIPKAQLPRNAAFKNLTNMVSKINHLTITIDLDLSVFCTLFKNLHRWAWASTDGTRSPKSKLYCQNIGDFLCANSKRLINFSSLQIIIKISLKELMEIINLFAERNAPTYDPPFRDLGRFTLTGGRTKAISGNIFPAIQDITNPIIGPLMRMNMKLMIDGSHESNKWNRTETMIDKLGSTLSIEFGGFEAFCAMLQSELLGESTPKAQNDIDSDARLCQMGLPTSARSPLSK
ncbi:uncharacterized protein PV06_02383 [Exophiala oligosperma]|uniref:Uncharacterized protein n=2 Tax=Chaetothyriales TaxID=34395 RepID=A0A0D2CA52_9EURO|nr:uncharacterized protein PV06_02383 [Exophiala oligosperma]KAJ9640643.1 hypothetical protein H2204_003272 [Knufia peltigerae]KIW46737.1 hypothetical protein PV06_02383 [Exophiala oligosperma]